MTGTSSPVCSLVLAAFMLCLSIAPAFGGEPVGGLPRIHTGKGLWWNFFGINDAAAELGGLYTSSYFDSAHKTLLGFPGSPRDLAEQDLIVLANVGANAVPPKLHPALKEFVENGGALFILGGRMSLDSGGFADSGLADILPCELKGKGRKKAEEPLILEPGPGAKDMLSADLCWQMEPRAYYFHDLEPKPGASVLMKAGEKPLLIVGSFGRGRVAVLGLSVEGDPPANELAFWEWPDLPRLMAAVCRGLIEAPETADEDTARSLEMEQLDGKLKSLSVPDGTGEAGRDKALAALAPDCRDSARAFALLGALSTFQSPPSRRLVNAVAEAVRPFAASAPIDVVETLIASGDPGKAELGLRVLGMARPAGAGERLARAAGQGLAGLQDSLFLAASGASLVDSASIMTMGGTDERVRLGAIMALGDLGDKAYIRTLAGATREFAGKRQMPPDIQETADANESAYQESLVSRVKLGDKSAMAPLLATALENENATEDYKNARDHLMRAHSKDKVLHRLIANCAAALPVYAERQDAVRRVLTSVPYELAQEIVTFLVANDDLRLSSFARASLAPSSARVPDLKTAEALLPLVEKGRCPDQRLLAFRIIADLKNLELTRRLENAMIMLASEGDTADLAFALNRVTELSPSVREKVLSAAAAHSNADIRRLAGLFKVSGN